MNLTQALIAVFVSGALIFGTRVLPFAVFSKKDPPLIIRFIEKYAAPLIMAVLVVYCFKDMSFTAGPDILPFCIASAVTVILHLTARNTMVSIFASTAVYMILSRVM